MIGSENLGVLLFPVCAVLLHFGILHHPGHGVYTTPKNRTQWDFNFLWGMYESVLLMSLFQLFLYPPLHLLQICEKSLSPFTSTVKVFLKGLLLVPHNSPYFLSTFSDQYKENNILK